MATPSNEFDEFDVEFYHSNAKKIQRNIYTFLDHGGKQWVVKLLNRDKLNEQELYRAYRLFSAFIEYPKVVKYKPSVVLLYFNYYKNGTLEDQYKTMSRKQLMRVFLDVVHALIDMHAAGFIHHDVKPANILITDDFRGNLTDFGLCQNMSSSKNKRVAGTNGFMSPEKLNHKSKKSCDIWALGVTMYYCLSGGFFPDTYKFHKSSGLANICNSDAALLKSMLDHVLVKRQTSLLSVKIALLDAL